jgi:hypothetical protein
MDREALATRRAALAADLDKARAAIRQHEVLVLRLQGAIALIDELLAEPVAELVLQEPAE